MSLALRKALSPSNIKKGFSTTGIFPLDFNVVAEHLLPSQVFKHPDGDLEGREGGQRLRQGDKQRVESHAEGPNEGHAVETIVANGDD